MKVLQAAASTRTAAVLIVLIAGAAAAGTFTSRDLYHSPLFAALLVLFGFNLVACTTKSVVCRTVRAGSLVTHLGIIFVLAGVIVDSMAGIRGEITISEGRETAFYKAGDSTGRLPFTVRLDDFEIRWQKDGKHTLDVEVTDPRAAMKIDVEPGRSYEVAGTPYSIEVARFVPDLLVTPDNGVKSRSDNPANPALLLVIRTPNAVEKRWVFGAHPDVSMARDRNIAVTYRYDTRPEDFSSSVTIVDDGGRTSKGVVRVNQPLKHAGWSLYQARFDAARPDWTGLTAVRSPGVELVFAGIVMMNVGVFLALFRRYRKSRTQSA